MNEFWRFVPGYAPIYEASTFGRIRTRNWKNTGQMMEMMPALDSNGYLRTVFVDPCCGRYDTVKVHRIIAKTFIPNPDNKPEVNHINGKKDDNRVENLEWVTHRENFNHAVENGTAGRLFTSNEENRYYKAVLDGRCEKVQGEKVGTSKLTASQVLEIREKFKPRIYTREMLAEEYGVMASCIKDVVNRKSWKHL